MAVNRQHGTLAWTGGQLSLIRGAAGATLLIRFAREIAGSRSGAAPLTDLVSASSPSLANLPALVLASGLAAALVFGVASRWSALGLAVLLAAQGQGLPRPEDVPWMAFLGVIALLPPAPFGSWSARGRTDPQGAWTFPRPLHLGLWSLIALSSGAAATHLVLADTEVRSWNILVPPIVEVLAGPSPRAAVTLAAVLGGIAILAIFSRSRPWIWVLLLALDLAGFFFGVPVGIGLGLLFLHLLAADPRWFPASRHEDVVFYDGACGLCHRSVRFLLAEESPDDTSPHPQLSFAPLGGGTFNARVPPRQQRNLPDSLAVLTTDGALLTEGRGVLRLLRHLGGFWGIAGSALALLPTGLVDFCYRRIAANRHRLFRRPKEACPLLPPDLGRRMLS